MKYPYYINPDIDALATAEGEERVRLVRHIAACVGDEATLRTLLGIDPQEFTRFYPDMIPPELSTEDTISSFISRFSSEKAAEVSQVEELVGAPAIDYVSMLDEEPGSEMPADDTSDAISAFLNAVPPKTPVKKASPALSSASDSESVPASGQVSDSDPRLSEGLLKLMVKNKNYEKALEIINELSLNNPKKSIYFAYQTRFIKKLIKNQAAAEKPKA